MSVLLIASAAGAANIRNHIEAVRHGSELVYLGFVREVEPAERPPRGRLHARARVEVLFVARSPADEAPRATQILDYPTWDDDHPPYAGDGQYRLDTGVLVVVFAEAWDREQPRYLLHGARDELLEDLVARRTRVGAMTAEQLRLHEIDAADQRVQVELYRRLADELAAVAGGSPAQPSP